MLYRRLVNESFDSFSTENSKKKEMQSFDLGKSTYIYRFSFARETLTPTIILFPSIVYRKNPRDWSFDRWKSSEESRTPATTRPYKITSRNSSNLRILLRINWSIDEDSSAFVASTMKWLFFFERRPRINERKKRERKEKKRFRSRVHRSSFPRRLHQAAQGYPILERRLQRGRFHAERAILVHGRDSLLLHAALALGSGIEVHVSSSKNFNLST